MLVPARHFSVMHVTVSKLSISGHLLRRTVCAGPDGVRLRESSCNPMQIYEERYRDRTFHRQLSPHFFSLQVYHDGKYGSVCDDAWDMKDANVVCRMLGMGNATAAVKRAKYGKAEGNIWMDDVNCTGKTHFYMGVPLSPGHLQRDHFAVL